MSCIFCKNCIIHTYIWENIPYKQKIKLFGIVMFTYFSGDSGKHFNNVRDFNALQLLEKILANLNNVFTYSQQETNLSHWKITLKAVYMVDYIQGQND